MGCSPKKPHTSGAGPRSVALRCPTATDDADAFVSLLMGCLRETVNQSRPSSQLLRLCARPARAIMSELIGSLGARECITHIAARSFVLEGQSRVHDFVCRLDCGRGASRVLSGRVRRDPQGWQLASLYQLPAASAGRAPRAGEGVPTTV